MSRELDVIKILLEHGISKYHISKKLGVTWNTVNRWSKGQSQPRQTYAVTLEKILADGTEK